MQSDASGPTRPALRTDAIVCTLLVALTALAFLDVLLGRGGFYIRDIARFYVPARHIFRDVVLGGEFPYWNRFVSAGQPLAANPEHEVFYPPTWLVLLPSFDFGFRFEILLHIWITLVGTYALLRSLGARSTAAAFGALSWGLGGITMSYVNLLPLLFTAAWIPLVCLFTRNFVRRGRWRDFSLAGLFFGLELLAGEPTTIVQTGVLLGAYALYRGLARGDRGRRTAIGLGAVALVSVAALLAGAVQMWPAAGHVRDSVRSRPFAYEVATLWSTPPQRLPEFLVANFAGHLDAFWGASLYPARNRAFLVSIYPGILVVIFVVAGFLRRRRGALLAAAIAVVSVAVALGSHTPLAHLFYASGLTAHVRYPEKFLLAGSFALVLFAALVLDDLIGGDEPTRTAARRAASALILVAVALAVWCFTRGYGESMSAFWRMPFSSPLLRIARLDLLRFLLTATSAFLLLSYSDVRSRRGWAAALLLVVFVDLGTIAEEVNPRMPPSYFAPPPGTLQLPPDHANYRLFPDADWARGESAELFTPAERADYRRYFSLGRGSYWAIRNGLFPMTAARYGIETVMETDYDETALLPTSAFMYSAWAIRRANPSAWAEPLMTMSNAQVRARLRPFRQAVSDAAGDPARIDPVVLESGPHTPRYYFAEEMVQIGGWQDFVRMVGSGSHSSRAAYVRGAAFHPAPGRVIASRETANGASIDIEAAGRAFLVISVTPHRYWRTTVDGHEVHAETTNVGYQGVEIAGGRHHVEMHYANPRVSQGAAVSIVAFVFLIVTALRKRDEKPSALDR